MECKICLMTTDISEIKDDICNFCVLHKTIDTNYIDFEPILEKIKISLVNTIVLLVYQEDWIVVLYYILQLKYGN